MKLPSHYYSATNQQSYIQLITAELPLLNEDQLFKVLVLVKNTVDENKTDRPLVSKNRSLFDPEMLTILPILNEDQDIANMVKAKLLELGFDGGYGIIQSGGKQTNKRGNAIYICFCVPNKIDAMIEICRMSEGGYSYTLSVKEIGLDNSSVAHFYSMNNSVNSLTSALKGLAKTYNNNSKK
jgi:hypothetical protein